MLEKIKKLLDEGKNYSEIGIILSIHRTTVSKFCKKHKIQINRKINVNCEVCSIEIKNNVKNNTKCKTCVTRLRRLRIKLKSVEYKGGKCEKCGYAKHLAALTFHHLDPNKKDFEIASSIHSKNWDVLQKELDKCMLLCSNCHNIEHSKYEDENLKKHL